jgi:uncharacterized membrane protein YeaQ/YmgE (transglycosylase-associated protein family)
VQILIALIVGAVIGMAAHFQVRERSTRGVALGPVIGALTASIAWMLLTWAGVGIDTPWPWLAAFVVPAAITYPVLLLLARARVAHDARERTRLKIG